MRRRQIPLPSSDQSGKEGGGRENHSCNRRRQAQTRRAGNRRDDSSSRPATRAIRRTPSPPYTRVLRPGPRKHKDDKKEVYIGTSSTSTLNSPSCDQESVASRMSVYQSGTDEWTN
ncbi:hypothetical protein PUN28_020761 [Cardiocondyla obscurior]|uniref:Uncharacterized protein n=1 Tax=Cardiocondyla obscurior TaxID=286306 RepID=A0AAW2E931_9HYME